jgi:hypothetical protein
MNAAFPVLAALVTATSSAATPDAPPPAPLNELGAATYLGFTGGLYPGGASQPEGAQADALRKMSTAIQPLDKAGNPDAKGKVVLVGIGASVCRQIFDVLDETETRGAVVFVNCAKGGHDVNKISDPERKYWESAVDTVRKAGFSPGQVQAAWYQSDDLRDTRTDFPGRPQRLQESIAKNMRELKQHFPNTRICYHSARHTTAFAPEAGSKEKHGEPRPWHVGWSVKWLIEEQAAGKAGLAFDGAGAEAPLMAWSTYFWTDGDKPRQDGYRWTREMNVADGVHLTGAGKIRVAGELLEFWRTDPFARTWFNSEAPASQPATPGARDAKPQVIAAQHLAPDEPALLVNGKSKFAKLERLLATTDPVRLVAFDAAGKQVLEVADVFHKRTDLNSLLGSGSFRLHFLGRDGQRIKMTTDVPDVVKLK